MQRSAIDWSNILILPVFILMAIPLAALGIGGGLKYKYFYPFVAAWILLHASTLARRMGMVSRSFWIFLIAAVGWFLVFTSLIQSGETTLLSTVSQCMVNFVPVLVMYVLIVERRFRELRWLTMLLALGLALQSLLMSRLNVGEARALATGVAKLSYEAAVKRAELSELGALGYGHVYTIVILMIATFFAFSKVDAKKKIVIVLLWGVYLFGIRQAAYTTSIGGLVIGFIFYLIGKVLNNRRGSRIYGRLLLLLTVGVVVVIAFPVVLFFLEEPLRAIGNSMGEEFHDYKGRLLSLADAVSGDKNTYAVERFSLYFMSFKTFLHHPILGVGHNARRFVGDALIGGHSTFFDTFATGGILLGAPLMLAYMSFARYVRVIYYKWFPPYIADYWYSVWFCCACIYLLFSCINTSTSFIPAITFLTVAMPFVVTPDEELYRREGPWFMPIQ